MIQAESPPRSKPAPRDSVPPPSARDSSITSHGRLKSRALAFLVVLAVAAVLWVARPLFLPLAFAVMLFFLLRPSVRWLTERRIPRSLASTIVLGSVIALAVFATTGLASPAISWAQRLPNAARQIEIKSRHLRYPIEHVSRGVQAVTRLVEVGRPDAVARVDVVRNGVMEGLLTHVVSGIVQAGLAVTAAFFLLLDGDALLGRMFRLVPPLPGNRRATAVANEVGAKMSRYLGAVTLVNLGLGIVLALVLAFLGMPNPWLWGLLAAVLTYVPYVGPAVGIGLVTLAAFTTFPTAGQAIVPGIAYFVLAAIEGNVVTPLVLGRTFAVRPLVLFVWFAVWAWLWSVPGAILATPMLMLFKVICDEFPRLPVVTYLIRR